MTFTSDGTGLVSGSGDGTLRLWDSRTGKEVRRFPIREKRGSQDQVMAMALSADGLRLASASLARPGESGLDMIVWDLRTAKQLLRGRVAGLLTPCFSADLSVVALPARDRIALHETITGKQIATINKEQLPDDEQIMSDGLVFSPDRRTLLGATLEEKGRHTTLRLWELASGKERLVIACGSRGYLTRIALAPDGRTAATVFDGRTIRVWDLATGKEAFHRDAFAEVICLAFAANSRSVASGHADGSILVWEVRSANESQGRSNKAEAKQLERWWAELAADARTAHAAIWGFVGVPEQAIPWLRDRLVAKSEVPAEKLRQMIADLDSPEFRRRAKASKELAALGEQAEQALRAALKTAPSVEQRKRIDRLLSASNGWQLRHVRSVEALEQIGTAGARRVLQELAKGAPDSRLTREATQALSRLTRRPGASRLLKKPGVR